MSLNYNERLKSIKLNITFYRKKAGLTQEQLAEKINISRTHMSNIEAVNMKTAVTVEILYEIADALGVDIVKFFELR